MRPMGWRAMKAARAVSALDLCTRNFQDGIGTSKDADGIIVRNSRNPGLVSVHGFSLCNNAPGQATADHVPRPRDIHSSMERFKRWLPDPDAVRTNRWLRWIGPALYHPALWSLRRGKDLDKDEEFQAKIQDPEQRAFVYGGGETLLNTKFPKEAYDDLGLPYGELGQRKAGMLPYLALLAGQSFWRQKNLALPMLTGRIEGKGPDLVPSNRAWLAAGLLLSVGVYWAWEFFLSLA